MDRDAVLKKIEHYEKLLEAARDEAERRAVLKAT